MNTPIYDFIKNYSKSEMSRLHMPGHKGKPFLGCEEFDITEIKGADSLYEAGGIIKESEENAAEIFDSEATFYSTEGSSLCIRAMLFAALMNKPEDKPAVICAARNVHKAFIYACAMLDIDIVWIYPESNNYLYGGAISPKEAEAVIKKHFPFALYLTSPNYLGEITDIKSMSDICDTYGIPLLVDNAHGAYLRFVGEHPINNGADMCCDSAHKTLPVLTGGAYLHVAKKSPFYSEYIKSGMSLFGSTSPSYLTLASLDLCNRYMLRDYKSDLLKCVDKISCLKKDLIERGFSLCGDEPLKITVFTDGRKAAEMLRKYNAECEYADKYCIVLMLTPENSEEDFEKIRQAFSELKPDDKKTPPPIENWQKVMTVREAIMSHQAEFDVEDAEGKICASPTVSCPPAIPIAVSGELISKETIKIFKHYNIEKISCVV